MSHSKQVQNPRRKYNVAREAARAAVQGHNQRNAVWVFVPMQREIKRIQSDIFQRNLLFAGRVPSCYSDDFPLVQVREVCRYFDMFPPPKEESLPCGNKVRCTPCFWPVEDINLDFGPAYGVGGLYGPHYSYEGTTSGLLDEYKRCEQQHKRLEKHHPDDELFQSTDRNSFECVFDVFNSLLRKHNVDDSYHALCAILSTSKFSNLDVKAVYSAFIHFHVRGVFASKTRGSSLWRKRHGLDISSLLREHENFCHGVAEPSIIKSYIYETFVHREAVESELRRLRIGISHDHTKYIRAHAYTYAWRWGVWDQIPSDLQYRLLCDASPFPGQETMFSLGKSFGDGMASSALPETTTAAINRAVEESVREVTPQLLDSARQVAQEISDRHESILGENVSRIESIMAKISASLDTVLSSFESIKEFITSTFGKFTTMVKGITGMESVDINMGKILMAIRDFILYVNVDSPTLKTVIIISLLANLGLAEVGWSYFCKISDYFKVESEEGPGVETAGIFGFLGGSANNMITILSGVFASIAAGTCLAKEQFWSLTKMLASPMKELHFIGGGCLGITRIFDFIKKIYSTVSEWILRNIFKKLPEQEQLARKIIVWVVKVKFFSSEAGLAAIRANQSTRDRAERLFPEYLELSAECRSKEIYRSMLLDVERYKREVRDIYDYIVRLRAVSDFCPTMFHLQFVGNYGVGKSTLTKQLSQDVMKSIWPDEKDLSLYSYNPNLEFFDGYAGQKIFYVDDVFRYQEPKHLTALIGLITNTPVILPMANLSDKGTQLTSEIAISSTNVPWPVGKDVLCMGAVQRRRHMLIETVIDPDVFDESAGAFSEALYLKKYKKEDMPKLPHLTFNLLRPVPRDESGDNSAMLDADSFDSLQRYARKLEEANQKILSRGSGNIDPMFYFSDENRPPEPIALPCKNWTYEQLLHNIVVRYRAFRGMEQTYNQTKKYALAETAVRELEGLFNQEENIPDGVELPISEGGRPFRLIEKWFTNVSHPYGVSDEVGQRLVESPAEGVAPELDDIDIDEVVEQIVDGGQETVLTMEQEIARARILRDRNARLRGRIPNEVKCRMRLFPFMTEEKGQRVILRLTPDATRWDHVDLGLNTGWKLLDKLSEANSLLKMYQSIWDTRIHRPVWGIEKQNKLQTVNAEIFKFVFGNEAHFPNNNIFGRDAGKRSTFPLFFLQRLHCDQAEEWYLDVTDLDFSDIIAEDPTVKVRKGDNEYSIPLDIAFMLSLSDVFRTFLYEFNALSIEQQKILVQDAKWRNLYTGFYTLKSIRESCTSIYKKLALKSLEYVLSPLHFLFHSRPDLLITAGGIAAFVGIVWTLRSMANLIIGKGEETSKFLHRGTQSRVIYHGQLTAQRENEFHKSVMDRHVKQLTLVDSELRMGFVQAIHTGRFVVMPKHALTGMVGDIIVMMRFSGTQDAIHFKIPRSNFIISEESDLCVFTLREIPQTRDLSKSFITEEQYKSMDFRGLMTFLSRHDGEAYFELHDYNRRVLKPKLTVGSRQVMLDRAIICSGETRVGFSGSTVVHMDHQRTPLITGIQVWSRGTLHAPEIAVQVITQELLLDMCKRAESVCQDFVERVADFELEEVEALPGMFTSAAVNNVLGQVPKSEMIGEVGRTAFRATPIAHQMERDGHASKRVPAALNWRDPRLVHPDHPLKHSVHKYVRGTVTTLSENEKNLAKDALELLIMQRLDTANFTPLTYEEVITGTREDGSSPMNLSTSPGLPFVHTKKQKGKQDYFSIGEDGLVDFVDPATRAEFGKFENMLRRRKLPLTCAYDFPKDELRPVDKVLGTSETPPKTRTVTCMNMFYLMAWRKYTLRFWASMHRAADGTFPFCPGINPEGPEWSNLYHYLNRHPNAIDFDVANWDGFLTPEMFFLVIDVISKVMGQSEEERNVLISIVFEVVNSHIQVGRVVFQKYRGMVSGFPGTAEINTLVHLFLIIYFWMRLAPFHLRTLAAFMHHVSAGLYGDDVQITVSDEALEFFNGETIQKQYINLGYKVTDASKNDAVLRSKPLAESTFLKSSWKRLFHHVYVRKMDIDVAYDLLYWVRAGDSPVEQFCTNIIDALRIVFGHGKKVYDAFVKQLARWLMEARIEQPLYSYQELLEDHVSRYYNILLPEKAIGLVPQE